MGLYLAVHETDTTKKLVGVMAAKLLMFKQSNWITLSESKADIPLCMTTRKCHRLRLTVRVFQNSTVNASFMDVPILRACECFVSESTAATLSGQNTQARPKNCTSLVRRCM